MARKYYKSSKTLRQRTIDFVETCGEVSFTQIQKFMFEVANPGEIYNKFEHRGFYCSYFSNNREFLNSISAGKIKVIYAKLLYPTKADKRILVKTKNGKYKVK